MTGSLHVSQATCVPSFPNGIRGWAACTHSIACHMHGQSAILQLHMAPCSSGATRSPGQPAGTHARLSADQTHASHACTLDMHAPSCMQVKELKANRARKLKARAKYEEYMQQQQQRRVGRQPQQAGGGAASGGGDGATDYARWDMWCPSDEEDDLFGSLTPNNAGFRMMERDINERHKRWEERARRGARRGGVAGRMRAPARDQKCSLTVAAVHHSLCNIGCATQPAAAPFQHPAGWSSSGSWPSASASRATPPWRPASGQRRCAATRWGWSTSATARRCTPTRRSRRSKCSATCRRSSTATG